MYIGHGIPTEKIRERFRVAPIQETQIPSEEDAIRDFAHDGGSLTLFPEFGKETLSGHPDLLQIREESFTKKFNNMEEIFHTIVNDNGRLFRDALLF